MSTFFFTALALSFAALMCFYRLIVGPTLPDKIAAVQVIGTKTLTILVLIAVIYGQMMFIDIALTYAVLLFLMVLATARYLETGRVVE
ncbi:MAG: monovalent cation/H+ antiporter complex subunit F [Methanocellales archaeon]|nr:monovalent cation/H+ antiporter complex subunit F [Methanocellales archaeon]